MERLSGLGAATAPRLTVAGLLDGAANSRPWPDGDADSLAKFTKAIGRDTNTPGEDVPTAKVDWGIDHVATAGKACFRAVHDAYDDGPLQTTSGNPLRLHVLPRPHAAAIDRHFT